MAGFYVYAADIYCEDCGDEIVTALRAERPDIAAMADAGKGLDSNEWPTGPYPHSMGETDSPAHCRACGAYLAHPLTAHGIRYAVEALADFVRHGTGSADVLAEWAADLRNYSLRGFAAIIRGAFDALQASPDRADRFYRRRERWQRRRARRSARNAESAGTG